MRFKTMEKNEKLKCCQEESVTRPRMSFAIHTFDGTALFKLMQKCTVLHKAKYYQAIQKLIHLH